MIKTILLVFGTRPEAIKMAPLVLALQKRPDEFRTVVAVTGQHREMLDQVLGLFGIKPDYDLNIMKPGQDLFDITSRILLGMRQVLAEVRPDLVLVHGDTSTSFAAALSAYYCQVPVGHVEAGLRTRDIYSPWPEEINRQLTGRIAALNISPTPLSAENLLQEHVDPASITVTGNTVIDALRLVVDKIDSSAGLADSLRADIRAMGYDMDRLSDGKRRMVLITGHRRENFGQGFKNIVEAIRQLSIKYPDVDFLYPMHLNPNVRRPIAEVFDNITHANVFFIEPVDYLPFVFLMKNSYLILTDSGGIQEEAPSLGKPVLVMRAVTERPEALEAGTIRLVGTDCDLIVSEASKFLDDDEYYAANQRIANPYGDGHACDRIIEFISQRLM